MSKEDEPQEFDFERLEQLEEQLNAGEMTKEEFRKEYADLLKNKSTVPHDIEPIDEFEGNEPESEELAINTLLERLEIESPTSESVFLEDLPTEECDPASREVHHLTPHSDNELTELIEQLSTAELPIDDGDKQITDANVFDAEGTTYIYPPSGINV